AVRTEYDDSGRVTAVIDALGNRQEQTFAPEQFTGTRTDANGNVTKLVYNDRGNVTEERKPTDDDPAHESITRYEYNDPANPDKETKNTDANGHATSFTYDANGNKTSITDALNNATT